MANEAVLMFETGPPIPMTIANGSAGTNIEKGTIMKLTDPFTVAASDSDGDPVGGILAEEKIGGDGKTTVGVYREGIFRVQVGATGITVGQGVMTYSGTGDANDVVVISAGEDNCMGIGLATNANNETGVIELKPMDRDIA